MEAIPFVMLGLYLLGGAAVVLILIYLVFKRINDSEKETFDKRDN
jgi:hypothetical protein